MRYYNRSGMKKRIIAASLVGVFCIGIAGYGLYINNENNISKNQSEMGYTTFSKKDYNKYLESQPSDIEGMSKYDKADEGLVIANNSDTDHDGLTDADEINIYKSDPLKLSTSGDLYTDGYKVANGMDINKEYEYTGPIEFKNNHCPEITLEAEDAIDLSAVVKDVSNNTTDFESLGINNIYKTYEIYNYSNDKLTINLNNLLPEGVSQDDIGVYVYEGAFLNDLGKTNSAGYDIDNNNMEVKYDFDSDKTYYILLSNKVTFASTIKSITEQKEEKNASGIALMIHLPIISSLTKFNQGYVFYYSEMPNTDETLAFRDNCFNYINNELTVSDNIWNQAFKRDYDIVNSESKNVNITSKKEINKKVEFLRKYLGIFEDDDWRVNHWYEFLFAFTVFDYSDGTVIASNGLHGNNGSKEERKNYNNYHTNFNQYVDEFSFQNFESEYGPSGNCLGIAHFISYLFNTGSYPSTGDYNGIAWNLTTDPANDTLLSPGVFDYKDIHFVDDKSGWNDDYLSPESLSAGEYEFVKMIGAAFREGNDRIDHNSHVKINGDLNDYSTLQNIMNYIDQGKVVNVCLALNNGTAHAITLYDYYWLDDEFVNFRVYDSNIPQSDRENYHINADGASYLQCKVVTQADGSQDFQYLYYPLRNNADYMASSYYYLMQVHCFIAIDENWNEF